MTDHQKKVLDFVEENPEATYEEIALGTGISKSSVQMSILSLQSRNIVSRVPPRWIIHKQNVE